MTPLRHTRPVMTGVGAHLKEITIARAPETCPGASTGSTGRSTGARMSKTPEGSEEGEGRISRRCLIEHRVSTEGIGILTDFLWWCWTPQCASQHSYSQLLLDRSTIFLHTLIFWWLALARGRSTLCLDHRQYLWVCLANK